MRDITERKQAEKILKENEEKYRLLFLTEQDAIIIVDSETMRIVDANDSALLLYGYNKDEFFTVTALDLSAEPKKSKAAIREITSSQNQKVHFHMRNHKKKDGTVFPVEISAGTFSLKGRKMISAIVRDITERKQTEDNLNLFRNLINQSNDAIFIVDPKTSHFLDFNDKACISLGYTREELLNMSVLGIEDNIIENFMHWVEHVKEVQKKGYVLTEGRHKRKDGTTFPVEINVKHVTIGHNKYMIGVVRDISERKQAEESLKLFRNLINQANDSIYIVSPKTGLLLDFNDTTHKNLGYTRKELLSMRVWDICLSVTENSFDKRVQEARKQGYLFFEGKQKCKDGSIFTVESNVQYISNENNDYIIVVARDITERKKSEEALLESEKQVRIKAEELTESNAALKVLLKQREDDKREFEENILSNIKHLVFPYIKKLKNNGDIEKGLAYLNILESNLKEIVSPFSAKLSSNYLGLTPKEIQIASLIKDGKQDKDIMEMLNISKDTAKTHRQNIRKKLGIYGKKANLRTYLLNSFK